MENIDDFMQRKFDSDDPAERFPFREEYWEQAQALIEADEQKRRKKRRFLFWWFTGMLLVGVAAFYFLYEPGVPAGMASSGPASNASPAVSSGGHSSEMDAVKKESMDTEQTENQQTSAPESARTATTETPADKTKSNPAISSNQGEKFMGKPTLPELQQNKPNPTGQNTKTTRTDAGGSITGGQHTVKTEFEAPTVISNSSTAVSANAEPETKVNPGAASTDAPVTPAPASSIQMNLLQALELPFPPAELSKPVLLLKKARREVAVNEIKPVHDKRLNWTVDASATAWSAGRGYTFGMSGQYKLNQRWSVAAGLKGRYVPLEPALIAPDSSDNVIVQYRYSFGLERTEYRRSVNSAWQMEIPVALHWRQGRFGLAAGLAPGMLLSVREKVVETKETTLGGIKTIGERSARGETTAFRTNYISTFASVEWRLMSRLGLTVQGNYRPSSILKPVENVVPPKNFWYLDMGLRWQF